jgi:hypothetical protein
VRKYWYAVSVIGLLLAASLPVHAVVLRFEPKVGETHRHKLTISGRMTMEMMGEEMRVETTAEVDYAEKALSREGDVTQYETELLGGELTMVNETLGGQTQTIDTPAGRVVAEYDGRGRLVKVVEHEFEGQVSEQPLMGSGPESMATSSHYGSFPEGDVKEGDVWSDTIVMPLAPDGPEVEMEFTSELLALTTFQSRKCAKIRTSFSAPLAVDATDFGVPASGEDAGGVEATLQGDVVMYYDYENSLYVYGQGTVGMDMNIAMAEAEMPGGDMTMKMIMNLKMVMVE